MASEQVQVRVLGQENGKLWTGSDAKTSTSSQNSLIATVNCLCLPPILPQQSLIWKAIYDFGNARGELILSIQSSHGVLNPYITMLWMLSNVYLLFPCFLVLLFSDVLIKCMRAWRVWKAGVPVPCMLRNRPSQQQGLIAKTWFLLLDKMYHSCILPSM